VQIVRLKGSKNIKRALSKNNKITTAVDTINSTYWTGQVCRRRPEQNRKHWENYQWDRIYCWRKRSKEWRNLWCNRRTDSYCAAGK